jgi:hypothetical protein
MYHRPGYATATKHHAVTSILETRGITMEMIMSLLIFYVALFAALRHIAPPIDKGGRK